MVFYREGTWIKEIFFHHGTIKVSSHFRSTSLLLSDLHGTGDVQIILIR
jgi:hypothetical protein